MKVLERFDDVAEAEVVSEKLRTRGILTHITSNPSAVMGLAPTRSARLWVVLPEQYLDAENCLKDEDYQPFKPLTQREANEEMQSSYTNHVAWTVIFAVLFVVFFVGFIFWMVGEGI